MGIEIERKFLVADESYKSLAVSKIEIRQGYLNREPTRTVRVRTKCESGKEGEGRLTVKGKNEGMSRKEFEYSVPYSDALAMLGLCEGNTVEKIRWVVPFGSRVWEVDEFSGRLQGLVLAEVELESENEEVTIPGFVGREVTGEACYYNSNL